MTDLSLFLSFFEQLPLPAVVFGLEGKPLFASARFYELTGYTPHLLRTDQEIFCDIPEERGRWELACQDGAVVCVDVERVLLRDSSGDPIGSASVFFVGASANRERMEILGTLAGGVAHDLNNLLTAILGHISFLRLALPAEGTFMESLSAIEDGGRRAAAMMQRFLDLARGDGGKTGPVNLSLTVSSAVNLLRAAFPKDIELVLSGEDQDLIVLGNESELNQMVINLAVNARDALVDGGRIEISLGLDSGEGRELAPGSYAKLRITDNGVGMPPEIRARIFEPFFTTKGKDGREHGGTGLGLFNVAMILRNCGGAIFVDSAPAQGTSFEVYLPALVDESSRSAGESTKQPLPSGRERILVVEDEEVVRTVVSRSLEHLGYAVTVAEHGVEALELYQPGKFDLVILDMMMPMMGGDEVFARLKQVDSEVAVLIASGYSSDGRARSILNSGGLGFIQKPFAVEELAREVRRCLDCRKQ